MPLSIPTIDIAPYLADPASPAAAAVVAAVRDACRTAGFFSLVGHGVPRALPQAVLRAGARLFAQPLATKAALRPAAASAAQLLNRGYEALGAQVLQAGARPDGKEGFFVGLDVPADDARARRHPRLTGPNVFPAEDDDGLRAACEAYYAAVLALARAVLRILARGLPYGDDVFAAFAHNDPLCNLDVRLAPLDGVGGDGPTVAEHMLARLDRSFALARQ